MLAADLSEARAMYYAGDYANCIAVAKAEVERGIRNDGWSRLLIECLMTVGRYEEARDVYVQAEPIFLSSIPLRLLGAQAHRFCGQSDVATKLLDEIPTLIGAAPWRFSDRENLVSIGRYALAEGEDPRSVLDAFYDKTLKSDPNFVEAHMAIAELAIDKSDYAEAVKSLNKAVLLRPADPQIHYLLAKAWAPSESDKATQSLKAALDLNPSHTPSLLMQAENLMDGERFDDAEKLLGMVEQINAALPELWALRAAMAHLQGRYQDEGNFRSKALQTWPTNPAVDYQIGRKLSQHYRFHESVTYQRRALKLNPNFLAAKFQLAQDLLRIGREDEGWSIVDQVSATDRYNVVAFNLRTLQENLSKFTTLEAPGLIIRMDQRESQIYGDRVIQLLTRAKETLAAKYDMAITDPVTVEIYPQQKDFAIRTFGLPGGAGFLGVCFGKLITANSPASQGETPSNWESVLWHEFCHVVTLQKTNNRMPRWLSEGISVYEELEVNPSWGQQINPVYKQMLEGEDFVPLSKLSSAFLSPKSQRHLQFAYFESSLAVRYLIEKHGLPMLRQLLVDLGMGVPMDDAFARRYGDVSVLDADFAEYISKFSLAFLQNVELDATDIPKRASVDELNAFLEDHPNNYIALKALAAAHLADKDWVAARKVADRMLTLYPTDAEPGGALEIAANAAREQHDRQAEIDALNRLCDLSCDNVPALLRMIQLHRDSGDWEQVHKYGQRMLAVQPLIAAGHEAVVDASVKLERPREAIGSLRAMQQLDPLDPAGLHYRLASALLGDGQIEQARIEVLAALEETPRYRDAQRLLLRIAQARENHKNDDVSREGQ